MEVAASLRVKNLMKRKSTLAPHSTLAFLISAIFLAGMGFVALWLLPIVGGSWRAVDAVVVSGSPEAL